MVLRAFSLTIDTPVNVIAPSPVETPLTADLQNSRDSYVETAERSMLRRWAKPDDFIGPTLLLASEAGAFITGAELFVDGGWTASDGLDRLRYQSTDTETTVVSRRPSPSASRAQA